MSITLKQVNKKSADYKKIKELYKKAFPVNERAPFFVFSDYLHRTDIIGCDINADMVVYTIWNNGNVCVFVYTHGGNNDNGLYILCV